MNMLKTKMKAFDIKINTRLSNLFFLFTLLIFSASVLAQNEGYVLQRGDVLEITVMEHPEFSIAGALIMPDGCIQFPGLGTIQAAGMSIKDFTELMNTYVGKYVVNPLLTVFTRSLPSQVVNVVGYVNRPGQITIFQATDLITALSKAGGIKDIRKCRKITIIRANQTFEVINVNKLFNSKKVQQFPKLNVGDTVYVIEPNEFNWSKLTFFTTLGYLTIQIVNLLR